LFSKTMLKLHQTVRSLFSSSSVHSFVQKAQNVFKALQMERSMFTSQLLAVQLVRSLTYRFWICHT
jgi:hypothetical protein